MKKIVYLLLASLLIVGVGSCSQNKHHAKPIHKTGGHKGKKGCNCPTWD